MNQRAALGQYLLPVLTRDLNHIPVTSSHVGPAADEGSRRRRGPAQPAPRLRRGAEHAEPRHQWERRHLVLRRPLLQETGRLQRHLRAVLHRLQGSHLLSQGAFCHFYLHAHTHTHLTGHVNLSDVQI